MGDQAPSQIVFYNVPHNEVRAVLSWLHEMEFVPNFMGSFDEMPDGWLELSSVYGDPQATVGVLYGINEGDTGADALAELAPGSTWKAWTDAKYEYEGVMFLHAPGLGVREHECNNDGVQMFSLAEVTALLADPVQARATLGLDHEQAINDAKGWVGDGCCVYGGPPPPEPDE